MRNGFQVMQRVKAYFARCYEISTFSFAQLTNGRQGQLVQASWTIQYGQSLTGRPEREYLFANGDSPVCERVDGEGLGWRCENGGKSHVEAVAI